MGVIFLILQISKEQKELNNVPKVIELQQQSSISSAFYHTPHTHILAALTDPIFPGNFCVSVKVCVPFMILPILPPTLKQGQEGQLWPHQAPFKEQHQGSQETIHLPSHTGRPSRACHSHCQTI